METLKISELIKVSDYYQRLTQLNQDAEIDLRNVMGRLTAESLSEALKTRKRFKHQWNHNRLCGVAKREDWYFYFEDENEAFDNTKLSLSELPLESKLILIDILQKL